MEKDNTEEIGKFAASLALIEIGLGSLLHAFKIPLSGHLLSINQIALLSRISFKLGSPKASFEISLVASILKSLSPAGKKLTPMLGIAMQGILYYLGIFILGLNPIGLLVAVLFASAWAFLQPVLFIYILFGKTSADVALHFLQEIEKIIPHIENVLLWIIIGLFIVKCVLTYAISFIAIKVSEEKFEKYQQRMILEIKKKPLSNHSPIFLALKDLLNPFFIISFLLTVIFFVYSNSTSATIFWELLRPLALGFILFYIVRIYPIQKLSNFLSHKGFKRMAKILDHAVKKTKPPRGF